MKAYWCNNCYYISEDIKEIHYVLDDKGWAKYCIKCKEVDNGK